MIQRDYIQENRYNMGTAGTLTFGLDYSDPITEISLLLEATNGASGNRSNPPELNISKIEIVDGGEVLWSAPGVVAFSTWCQLNQGLPHCYRSGANGDSPWTPINLLFGRYLYDAEYAFNALAHKNPQLKVTFDEASVRAAGVTGYVSDSFNLSILVKLMEDAPPPVGFLSLREIESFSSASAGDRKVELPTDAPIRFINTRVYESGVHMSNHITRYKLSADGARRVLFDLLYRNMRDKCSEYFKPISMPQYSLVTNGDTPQSWMGDGFDCTAGAHEANYIVNAGSHSGGRMLLYVSDLSGTPATNRICHFQATGFPLHQMFIYPFGKLDTPEDWLDARVYNKLDYILSQGNEDGTIQVGVQRVYAY